MSIAELIMQGTNRSSQSTAWVGDSLAKLGQNVGAALAQREQQKQAQEMLPFLQQSMQESMTLAGKGQTGEAYAKLMPFLTDPSVARNPFMMPALEAGIKMNQIAADDYLRNRQISAYESRYSGGTGGGGGGLPSGPQAFFGTNPADTEPLPTRENYVETVSEIPENAGGAMPGFTGNFAFGLNEPTQELPWSYQNPDTIQPSPEVQQSFEKNQQEYLGASPDKQQTYQNNLSSTTIPKGTNVSKFDFSNIKSLRNVVGIAAPVEMQVEVPESLSITENDKGKSYLTKFNKKTTNEVVINKSNDLVLTDVPKSLGLISSNKTLAKYFRENDLGKLDIGIKAKKGSKEESYYIGIDGKKDSYIAISKDDFIAASTIQNLPSSARTLDSTFIITDQPMEEATTQNMSIAEQVRSQYGKKEETAPAAAPAATPPPPQQEPTMFDVQIKGEEEATKSNVLNSKIQKLQKEIANYDAEISNLQAPTSMIAAAIPAKKKQELLLKFKDQRAKKQKELDSLSSSK